MNSRRMLATGVAVSVVLGFSVAQASGQKGITVVRGNVQVQKANTWVSSREVAVGSWVRASGNDAVLQVSGVAMRLEPGAQVRVADVDGARLDARGGRIYIKVGQSSQCSVKTPKNVVSAGESEFVVDASANDRLYVQPGNARTEKVTAITPPAAWSKDLALDGPDVRKRNRNRKRFTQGEENKGKRIGEDSPPSSTPSPTFSQSPAFTPTPTPPLQPPPSPPPGNPPQPPSVGGGGNAWPWIGGALGAGGVAYGVSRLVNNNGGGQNPVNRPASP